MKILSLFLFPLLILATVFEIVKRIVFWFVYPIAYRKRKWPNPKHDFWWLAMDDSICISNMERVGKPWDYCIDPSKQSAAFGKTKEPKDCKPEDYKPNFRMAFYWGAWRNSAINLRDIMDLKTKAEPLAVIHLGKSFYEARRYKWVALPYLEMWFGGFRLQAGWLRDGFFQVQFRKLR